MQNYREAMEGRHCLLPELSMVGCADIKLARIPGLLAHQHRSAYELFYLERGEVDWWVENEVVTLKANHVYVNKPGEKHGSVGPSLKPCSYYWIQLVFPRGKQLPGLGVRQSATWQKALSTLNPRSFPGTLELKHYFERIFEECRAPRQDSAVIARSNLHLLLGTLLRLHEAHLQSSSPRPYTSFAIRNALRWIDAHFAEQVSMQKLARVSKLGLSRFRERFHEEVGFSPHSYLARRRVEEARKRLQTSSDTITEIAHGVGFGTSQYFATVFKRMEGISPGDFRSGLTSKPAAPGKKSAPKKRSSS